MTPDRFPPGALPRARPFSAAPEPGEPDVAVGARLPVWLAWIDGPVLAGLFGFAAMLPYPAVPAGSNTAVQTGNFLSLLLFVPCLLVPWKSRPFYLPLLLVGAVGLSLGKAAFTGGDLSLCFKSVLVMGLSAAALLATQYVAPRHGLHLLTGIATATVLHAAVGAWQVYAFSHGTIPLAGLYVNPSFASVKDNADITLYIRRPFGLFPEPSAMSSSLAPWAVFWTALALGLVKLRQEPRRWQRGLFITAAAGAIGLIIVSRSGHSAITLAAVAACAVVWLVRSPVTGRTYLAAVAAFGVALPVLLWLTANSLAERTGGGSVMAETSWRGRAASLVDGLSLLLDGDAWTLLFGLGPGLVSPAIKKATGYDAVWSVLLPYLYQTGLVGLAAVCLVGRHLARAWRATGFAAAYAAVLFVWLVGVTVTTSYGQLLPQWLVLGWLTVWPLVCSPGPRPLRSSGPAFAPRPAFRPRPRGTVAELSTGPALPNRNRLES